MNIENGVEWIVYGLGSALCSYQPDVRIAALAQAASISITDASAAIDDAFVARCNSGEFTLARMLDAIRERLDADLTYAHLMGLWSLAYQPDTDAINVAHELRSKQSGSVNTALLCAGSPLLDDALAAYLPEASQLVSHTYFSYRYHQASVSETVFSGVRADLNMPGESLIYVSNNARARGAAIQDGWRVAQIEQFAFGRSTVDE